MTETTPAPARSSYYVALDGLRAVAVIMVFFQHYGGRTPFIFRWGWTGVDIFFVLSGFLITGILYDSRDKLHRYRDFYVRRTLRIFPLYYFLWLVILLVTPLAHWQWSWRWALWPAYLGNHARFLFLHLPGDPYRFDKLAFGAPFNAHFGYTVHLYIGHFWSLCLEEQFYLLWPLVVYRVRERQKLIRLCLAVIVLSPVLRGLLSLTMPQPMLFIEFLYRCLFTRFDALLIGGLIALCLRGKEAELVRKVRRPLLLVSALLLLVLFGTATRLLHLPYYGSQSSWVAVFGYTLIDAFAAGLILECIHPGSLLQRVLSWKPLRLLGIISYGFYVYHDLFHDFYSDFANRYFPAHVYAVTLLTAFTATVLIASVSYLLLERPMLKLKDRFAGQIHTAPAA